MGKAFTSVVAVSHRRVNGVEIEHEAVGISGRGCCPAGVIAAV
jgi:hypothetical protein